MASEFIEKLYNALKNEPLIQKYLYNDTWTSGCSTTVFPITFWRDEVEIQLTTNKNIFSKFIKRFVNKNINLITSGIFSKSDGSCPSTLTFFL